MTTTFGDLVQVADRHLRVAHRTDISGLPPTEHAQVITALAECVRAVRLLWRTADRPDHPFHDYDAAWRRAGRELSTGLTVASRCLARAGAMSEPSTWCVPALHLSAAGVAIGAGHDLLATHTRLTAHGPMDRTGYRALIDSPDGRRAVAEACAQHLPYLAKTADALGMAVDAGRPAREAALRASEALHATDRAISNAGILTRPPNDLLPGIRVVEPLRLHPVRDGESPDELLREAVLGIERLHRVALEELGAARIERHSAGAMASVAVAMAVTHQISSRLLRHVAPVADFGLEGSARSEYVVTLEEAAAASDRSAEAWTKVREAWRGIRGIREHGPPEVIRVEASDLTIRIGRLAHSDPAWLPKVGASHELREPSELCPNRAETVRLIDGLQKFAADSGLVSQDYSLLLGRRGLRDQLLVSTRSLPEDSDVRRPWSVAPEQRVRDLRVALSGARVAAHEAAHLVETIHEPIQPSGGHLRDERRSQGQARTM